MVSVYTNHLRLEEIGTGEQSGDWGATTNTNLELIAEGFSYGTEAIGDANTTITMADGASDGARSLYLKITSSTNLTATRTITLAPNTVSKVWIIENATSGSQIITIKQGTGGGASVNIANGQVKMIATDGGGTGGIVYDLLTDVELAGTTTATALTVDDVAIDGKVITMTGSTGDTAVMTVGTNGVLTITTTDTAAAAANITITADGTFEAVGTTITLDSGGDIELEAAAGGDVNIPANIGLTFGDDGEKIEGDGTDLTISGNNINLTATADVNIPSGVGLTFATAEKIESDGTDLSITVGSGGDINIPANIGVTFGDDGEKIEGDGTDLTISGNNINLTATADVVIPANVGVTFGTGEKIEGDSTDLTITSGAKINLTATSDVIIPSGVGLVLDGSGNEKIESDGTDISISVGSGGDINIPANIGVTFGDDGEKIEGDGTDLTISGNNINLSPTSTVTVSGVVDVTDTTDATDATGDTGALRTEGGASIAKKLFVGTDLTVGGDLTISGDDLVMGTNTSGMLLIADGTNFNPTAISSLSEISTAADDDVLIAIDTSGGGLKKISRSTIIAGTGSSGDLANVVEDTSPQLGGNLDTNSNNILIDDAHFIGDENGNEQIIFQTTSSAVNEIEITNAASGSGVQIASTGGDTNIDLKLLPKGSGQVVIDGNVGIESGLIDLKNAGAVSKIKFYCESSNAHAQTLQGAPHSETASNTLTLPSTGGNVNLVSTASTATLTNKTFGDNTSFGDNNITNVGDIALDSISADGTDINVAVSDNSATALTIKQGSDAYLIIDTANSSESVSIGTGISGTAITLGHSTSEVTVADNLTVTGNLTVNGATTTVATTNTTVADHLIKLGQGYTGSANDQGIIFTRGNGSSSNTQNVGFLWDESADTFVLANTNDEAGTTTGNVDLDDYANLRIGAITADDNSTFSGEIAAASLDISGDVDVDGTLEADAITVNGTTLTEFVQDTVGAMVSSNTESGISVTYEDSDGTLDFSVSASSAADDISTGDAAVNIATSAGNITLDAQGSDTDIIFKGTDGSSDTTFLTLDGSDAGTAIFNHDVKLLSDAAILNFGADNDVNLTHVADTGLLLNSTRQLQFGDSGTYIHQSADGVLDLVSDTELELNATTIDINGDVEISGTLAQAGVLTANAGVVVDNITIDGTEIDLSSGDLTIDVAGDLVLDTGGRDIKFNYAGTHEANIHTGTGSTVFSTIVSDRDLAFAGNDGGSTITALTLDMSDAGAATFNSTVTAPNFNTTSDKTLKTNIVTLTNALDKVNTLRGVSFDWIKTKESEIGLIAQEVEEVVKESVHTNEDGIKSVKYGNMVALLIEAVKEQQVQINDLKKQIEEK